VSIPFIDLKTQYQNLKEDIDARIHAVLDHGKYIMGPEVAELEETLAAFCGAKYAVAVANGTDALQIALMAHGIGRDDAVFVPSFTFTATAEVVLLLGATPVFVDVFEDTFNIDPSSLRQRVADVKAKGTLTPKAIIAVDLFGQPADYETINALAKEEGMIVVADSAQSFGASSGGKKVGTLADITTTSFFPAKPLGCFGDGGAIFTNDDAIAGAIRSIRLHGKGGAKYDIIRVGANSRLDTIQAAVLLSKIAVFPEELVSRHKVATAYNDAFGTLSKTPSLLDGTSSAWAQYTLRAANRDEVVAKIKEQDIPVAVYYPLPMHLQSAYREFGKGEGDLPVCERLSKEVFSLPMHPYMDSTTIEKVCEAVTKALSD